MIVWNSFLKYFVFPALNAKLLVAVLIVVLLYLRNRDRSIRLLSFAQHSRTKILLALIIGGLALRLFWIYWSPHTAPSAATEDSIVLKHARDLAEGRGYISLQGDYTAIRPVAYPFLLSILFRFTGENIRLIEILQVLFSTLSIYVIYQIGTQIQDALTGCIAAFLWALSPNSIYATKIILEEHLFILLWLLGISLLISDFYTPKLKTLFLSGFILGLSAHLRTFSFATGAVVFMVWWLAKKQLRAAFYRALIVQLCIFAFAVPWAIRNYYRLGSPILYTTSVGTAMYFGNNPMPIPINPSLEKGGDRDYLLAKSEVERNRAGKKAAWNWISDHPTLFLQKAIARVIYMLGLDREGWTVMDNFYTIQKSRKRPPEKLILFFDKLENNFYAIVFLLAIMGIIIFLIKPSTTLKDSSPGWILMVILSYLFFIGLTLGHRKYRFPLDPLFCLFAAYALRWLLSHKPLPEDFQAAKIV